ncbi:hypothetical protein [Enterococcus canis]|nr:hypothetical protein [Enterococcus canis]
MHQVLVDIILDAIIERYQTEQQFLEDALGLDAVKWDLWKEGRGTLSGEEMQKVKMLFTDYEWMLVQKILRQTVLFPEKRAIAVSEYQRIKTEIAKKWLQSSAGQIELEKQKNNDELRAIDLKVSIHYGEWGYDDIITFRLPALLQPQLEGSKVELLDWVNENLTETYVKE